VTKEAAHRVGGALLALAKGMDAGLALDVLTGAVPVVSRAAGGMRPGGMEQGGIPMEPAGVLRPVPPGAQVTVSDPQEARMLPGTAPRVILGL
jgi:hypothetical protein